MLSIYVSQRFQWKSIGLAALQSVFLKNFCKKLNIHNKENKNQNRRWEWTKLSKTDETKKWKKFFSSKENNVHLDGMKNLVVESLLEIIWSHSAKNFLISFILFKVKTLPYMFNVSDVVEEFVCAETERTMLKCNICLRSRFYALLCE